MKSFTEDTSIIVNATDTAQPAPGAFTEIIGKNHVKKLLLVLGDIGILYLSLYVSLAIRGSVVPTAEAWSNSITPFTILFAVWILVFYINDLYEIAFSCNALGFYNRILQSLLINFSVGFG